MTFVGEIRDGRIVLPGNPPLPEGASVRIEVYHIPEPTALVKVRTKPVDKLAQMLMQVAGKVSRLPKEQAKSGNQILIGAPKE